MSGVTTFAVDAPVGARTLVEASAGTGKTHALSGLAVQLIATGEVTTDQLLVVTFTRLAAAELRDRIRARLLATRAALRDGVAHDDLSESLLARADPDLEANLVRGLLAYDELAVSTFHAFAQRTLTALGSRARVDPDAGILTDQRELLAEVSADVLAIAAQQAQAELGDDWRSGLAVLPALSTLVKVATQRTDLPDLLLDPEHDTPELRGLLGGDARPPRGAGLGVGCAAPTTGRAPQLRRGPRRPPRRALRCRWPRARRTGPWAPARRVDRRVPGHRPPPVGHLRPGLRA